MASSRMIQAMAAADYDASLALLIARDRCSYCGRPREVLLDQRPGAASKAILPITCRSLLQCFKECSRTTNGPEQQ